MRAVSYVIGFVAVPAGLSTSTVGVHGTRLKSLGFRWIVSSGRPLTKQFRGRRSHFSLPAQNSGNSGWLSSGQRERQRSADRTTETVKCEPSASFSLSPSCWSHPRWPVRLRADCPVSAPSPITARRSLPRCPRPFWSRFAELALPPTVLDRSAGGRCAAGVLLSACWRQSAA